MAHSPGQRKLQLCRLPVPRGSPGRSTEMLAPLLRAPSEVPPPLPDLRGEQSEPLSELWSRGCRSVRTFARTQVRCIPRLEQSSAREALSSPSCSHWLDMGSCPTRVSGERAPGLPY